MFIISIQFKWVTTVNNIEGLLCLEEDAYIEIAKQRKLVVSRLQAPS